MTAEVEKSPLDELRGAVRGTVLVAGDEGYDEARHVWNGMIDRHPPVIVCVTGVADVIAAVNYARDSGLPVSVKGGGHSAAGTAVSDEALMVNLASMNGVFIDPKARTARVQGGATWGALDRDSQVHGLATTGGVISTTGVGGLTLGGGLGWLMGKHGLAIDNLLSAEVVLSSGDVVTASPAENSDLFWALRGGSGNFGVVTSLEFQLHEVGPVVTGGLAAWPIAQRGEVLEFYRSFSASTPDELTSFLVFAGMPDGSDAYMTALIALHCGSLADGEQALGPVKEFGPPMMDMLGPIPYTAHQSMLDAGFPAGAQVYWKSTFLRELSDEAMAVITRRSAEIPTLQSALVLEHFHGAVNRVASDATAFSERGAAYNVAIVAMWNDASDADRCISWARAVFEDLQPFSTGGVYVNYLGVGDDEARIKAAFGGNFDRLVAIKQKYDPSNVFRANQNIRPLRPAV